MSVFVQMMVLLIIDLEQKKSIVTSGVMFMFFLVLSIFGILSCYTHISQAAGVCLLCFFIFHFTQHFMLLATALVVESFVSTLHPRYNALQYKADSVITRLRSWTPIFHVGPVSY